MSTLKGAGGELRATIHITRKATGKVETFHLVGHTSPEQHAKIMKMIESGELKFDDLAKDPQALGVSIEPVRTNHGSAGAIVGPGANVKQGDDDGSNP